MLLLGYSGVSVDWDEGWDWVLLLGYYWWLWWCVIIGEADSTICIGVIIDRLTVLLLMMIYIKLLLL